LQFLSQLPHFLQFVLYVTVFGSASVLLNRLFYGRCEKRIDSDLKFKSSLKPSDLVEKFQESADINKTLVMFNKPFRITMTGMIFSLTRRKSGGKRSRKPAANMIFHGEIFEIKDGSEIVGCYYDFKPNRTWDWIQALLWWPFVISCWLLFLDFNLYLIVGLVVVSWIVSGRSLFMKIQDQILANERDYIKNFIQLTCNGTSFLPGGAPKRPHL
jgi:hypothetical protein